LFRSQQFLTGAAEMNLYDNDSYQGGNERALTTVRRLLGVMHLLKNADCFDPRPERTEHHTGEDNQDVKDVSMFVIM
jgi:hypothetical protein